MASAGLKRPSDFELNCTQGSGSGCANSSSVWPTHNSANKRRCLTNFSPLANQIAPYNTSPNNTIQGFQTNQYNEQQNQHHQQQQQQLLQNNHNHYQTSSPFRTPSDVLNSLNEEINTMIKNEQLKAHNHSNNNTNDPPVLTIRQTQMICDKLIKEKEQQLREEYDKILINKLAEQYDTFVKYTRDHIEKRYNQLDSYQASYLS